MIELITNVWKENSSQPLREYYLTVTLFGFTTSGYSSVRLRFKRLGKAIGKFPMMKRNCNCEKLTWITA